MNCLKNRPEQLCTLLNVNFKCSLKQQVVFGQACWQICRGLFCPLPAPV